eukprot:CAMPEP_0119309952 /NCGR_PEP_ID=MMETSP1333-20130426/17610_1 /TAXON_ID=418940 /ORGANISM="Scyphosphaera apsteinii, Strain RCC1455" /LENGTH=314 /DNA_ID=CAMNT_0007314043 /DNA_START=57 /DNA_END=1001 /DNA_ORIENTATION=-
MPLDVSPQYCAPTGSLCLQDAFDEDDEALQAVLYASLSSAPTETEAPAAAAQAEALSAFVPPPLVGKPCSLASYASETTLSDELRRALQELSEGPKHLMMCHVRGDGHCLFRSIAASIVLTAAWGGLQHAQMLRDHLDSLHGTSADEVVGALEVLLGRSAADLGLVAARLNEENGVSDRAVHALRKCAVSYMRKHLERFRLCCDDGDFESYCARMESMGGSTPTHSPAYGSHSEIVALTECLRVRVEIVDCTQTIGTVSTLPVFRVGEHLPVSCPTVYLLHRGPHYHLLLSAQAEGERIADAPVESDDNDSLEQ